MTSSAAPRLPPSPFVYPILDAALLRGRTVEEALRSLARAGISLVQVRAKALSDREWADLARRAAQAAREAGLTLIVNDRADLARMAKADGVHVGQDDLPPRAARAVVGDHRLVGLSTHSLGQLQRALPEPLDYLAVGPVFATRTKENPDPVVGLDLVRRARALTALPLVAIGGITRGNARTVIEAGADGVAVISDLLQAPDLEAAAASLVAALAAK